MSSISIQHSPDKMELLDGYYKARDHFYKVLKVCCLSLGLRSDSKPSSEEPGGVSGRRRGGNFLSSGDPLRRLR